MTLTADGFHRPNRNDETSRSIKDLISHCSVTVLKDYPTDVETGINAGEKYI